uniref:Uncharacterized protein n=2 Tax=Phytophthora ramorum TaxID=164328 RepID=H3GEJ7_PHYRM
MNRLWVTFLLLVLISMTSVASETAEFSFSFWDDDDDSSEASSQATETHSPSTTAPVAQASPSGTSLSLAPSSDSPALTSGSSSLAATLAAEQTAASGSSALAALVTANYSIATPATAINTVTSTYRNWVGPWSISSDAACYREAHIMLTCPTDYNRNDATDTCWTQCPIGYPVECGMECIRQNDDCKLEIFNKVSVIAVTALDAASMGIFGKLEDIGKGIKRAVKCANSMMTVIRALVRYVRNIKTSDPQTSQAQLLAILYQTNNVVTDIPIAITNCLGWTVPGNLLTSKYVLATSQYILSQILANGDEIISSWDHFKAFLKGANFTEAADGLNSSDISSLETGMKSNSTCGADLKSLLDRTWMTVEQCRQEDPDISDADVRLKISNSDLVRYDVAMVTNNCMPLMIEQSTEVTAYKSRETLRKTFGVIINDLISKGTSNNGTTLKAQHYTYKALQIGLNVLSTSGFDDLDISTLLGAYVQTICGPTQFMGEIDDGTEAATLGLNTIEDAFNGSTSSWKRVGNGAVIINFSSSDKKDVKVNIHSGGEEIAQVPVSAGGTATWTSNTTALGGKTLYLDRWRDDAIGIPGTGGGSLVLWVPKASKGGHLLLNAQLNVS